MSIYALGDKLLTDKDLQVDRTNYFRNSSLEIQTGKLKSDGTIWIFDYADWSNKDHVNETWTASVFIDNSQGKAPLYIQSWSSKLGMIFGNPINTGTQGISSFTFNTGNSTAETLSNINFVIATDASKYKDLDFDVKYKQQMLEHGTLVTSWTPNPQDIQSKIQDLQNQINQLKK